MTNSTESIHRNTVPSAETANTATGEHDFAILEASRRVLDKVGVASPQSTMYRFENGYGELFPVSALVDLRNQQVLAANTFIDNEEQARIADANTYEGALEIIDTLQPGNPVREHALFSLAMHRLQTGDTNTSLELAKKIKDLPRQLEVLAEIERTDHSFKLTESIEAKAHAIIDTALDPDDDPNSPEEVLPINEAIAIESAGRLLGDPELVNTASQAIVAHLAERAPEELRSRRATMSGTDRIKYRESAASQIKKSSNVRYRTLEEDVERTQYPN